MTEDAGTHTRMYIYVCVLSRVPLFSTHWTIALQAPLSMGFPRQGYWSGLPFHSPGDLPNPRIEPVSPVSLALQTCSLPAFFFFFLPYHEACGILVPLQGIEPEFSALKVQSLRPPTGVLKFHMQLKFDFYWTALV